MKFSFVKKISGVTMIELMIVIVIIGVLAGFAMPQFGGLIQKQSLLSESRRITSLLKLARSEARARATHVTISRGAAADWGGEITVYENIDMADEQYNAAVVAGSKGDEEIKVSVSAGRSLVADASFDTQYITFNPRGWVQSAFSIAVCSSATNKTSGRLIQVNRVGKIEEGPIDAAGSCTQ